jgi:hypothetical protein
MDMKFTANVPPQNTGERIPFSKSSAGTIHSLMDMHRDKTKLDLCPMPNTKINFGQTG